ATLSTGLGFSQSYSAQLRVNKDGIGHQAITYSGTAAFEQICTNNAEIVVRNVGEGGAAFHITQRIDARYICLQPLIYLDRAAFIHLHARCRQVEPIGVGNTASGQEQVRSAKSTFPGWCTYRQLNSTAS